MEHIRLIILLGEIAALPTASFNEHLVLRRLAQHAAALGLPAAQDRWGNLHVRYRRGRPRSPWVIVAHADHPGFIVTKANGRRALGRWFGRVRPEYFSGAAVQMAGNARGVIRGHVTSVRFGAHTDRVEWVNLETSGPASHGMLGTWDIAPFRRTGDLIRLRAADDLAGCALLAALLESLVAGHRNAAVDVVFTRAEEAGLLGATALARSGCIPRACPILSIETSSERPTAKIGSGPVLRTGDRMAIFDPGLAFWMQSVAAELACTAPGFCYQRALMDGGTCEASPFAAFGYRTAALAIPLGNYHNMGPRAIAPEIVAASDLMNCLRLLEALVIRPLPRQRDLSGADANLLATLLQPHERILRSSVSRPYASWTKTRAKRAPRKPRRSRSS